MRPPHLASLAPRLADVTPGPRLRRRVLTVASLGGLAALLPAGLCAQAELTFEVGASQIGPATGLDTEDARYLIGGLRGSFEASGGGGLQASILGGSALGDSTGGSFFSGMVEGTIRSRWSDRWSGAFDSRLIAFGVRDPFPYRAAAAEFGPSIRYRAPSASVEVGAVAGVGHSRVTLWRRLGGLTRTFEDDLWRLGTTAEATVGSPTVQVGVAGSLHRASAQTYGSLGGRLVLAGAWGALELSVDRWDTPVGYETTGGLSFAVPLGARWSFRGFLGRGDPDPLMLTQPGSRSGGALLGWTVYSTGVDVTDAQPLYEVMARDGTATRIRVALDDVPAEARSVQVLGDFTLWEPVAMQRNGTRWVAEVDVRPGTHHYGFLVDDEWYLPDDAPDAAPDEWGRMTATLVIEGAGS